MACNESQYLSTFVTHFDFRLGDALGTILIKIIIRPPPQVTPEVPSAPLNDVSLI